MNKTELVALMAEEAGITKKDAEKALNAFIGGVQNAVKAGDKVSLIGFGTFEARERAAREGKNPQKKKKIKNLYFHRKIYHINFGYINEYN